MACEWRTKLDAYVDTELNDAEYAQMRAHVLTCPSCAAEALERSQMKRAVRSAAIATYSPRPEFRMKIESIARRSKPRRWFVVPRLVPAIAVVAALLLVAALFLYRPQPRDLMAELADQHVATLASTNPVDVVSTDRHTVKPWFAGKLPFTFNLPELQNTPYRLVGGRVTYLDQTPGAQLLFTYGKHQISVFIFQDRNDLARLTSRLSRQRQLQFTTQTWSAVGLRYFAITDAGAGELRGLTDLLKSASTS